MDLNRIAGKTLIITGASLGIGRALSLELAREGVNLVLNARGVDQLRETAGECMKAGVKVDWVAGSAGSDRFAPRLVEKAVEIGNFYGFIHAAGVLHPGPFLWELPNDSFREIIESNVEGAFQVAKAAFPRLPDGGVAVFFGSGAAEMAVPGLAAYCVAKAAEEHLARQLAAEAPWITTIIFRPGVVDTRMTRAAARAQGGAAANLREHFGEYARKGELLTPEVPAKALTAILKDNPRRFHGKIASWKDGI